jgi:hypothetical protein
LTQACITDGQSEFLINNQPRIRRYIAVNKPCRKTCSKPIKSKCKQETKTRPLLRQNGNRRLLVTRQQSDTTHTRMTPHILLISLKAGTPPIPFPDTLSSSPRHSSQRTHILDIGRANTKLYTLHLRDIKCGVATTYAAAAMAPNPESQRLHPAQKHVARNDQRRETTRVRRAYKMHIQKVTM